MTVTIIFHNGTILDNLTPEQIKLLEHHKELDRQRREKARIAAAMSSEDLAQQKVEIELERAKYEREKEEYDRKKARLQLQQSNNNEQDLQEQLKKERQLREDVQKQFEKERQQREDVQKQFEDLQKQFEKERQLQEENKRSQLSKAVYDSVGTKRYTLRLNPKRSSIKSKKEVDAVNEFSETMKFQTFLQLLRDQAPETVKKQFDDISQNKKQELCAMLHNNENDSHDERALILALMLSFLPVPSGCKTYLFTKGTSTLRDTNKSKDCNEDKSPESAKPVEDNGGIPLVFPDVFCTTEVLQTTKKRPAAPVPKQPNKKRKCEQGVVVVNEDTNTQLNSVSERYQAAKDSMDLFANYAVETGDFYHPRVYFDIKSNFRDEVVDPFKKYADHAYYLLTQSDEASKYKETILIATDLNGLFGINWITPCYESNKTKEVIIGFTCKKGLEYGEVSFEKPEEILEVIYLLLWRMVDKLKASGEKKVVVFSHELGPTIDVQSLEDTVTQVTLIQALKVDSDSAVLKVNYKGEPCVLKISSHDRIRKEMKALDDLAKLDNIPRVILCGEIIGYPCLLTTFLEGATLFSLIKPIDVVDLVTIMTQLQDFVSKLNLLSYSHGDLHPRNILWCSTTQKVNVIDFDRAQKTNALNSMDDEVFISVIQKFLSSEHSDFETDLQNKFYEIEHSATPYSNFKDYSTPDDSSSDEYSLVY